MLEAMSLPILVGTVLVIAAIFTSYFSLRLGAPLLLVFLLVGLAAGEDGLGLAYDDAPSAYFIGALALAIILFDSGFATPTSTLRLAAWPAALLATLGVLLTTLVVGVAARILFGWNWFESFVMGAIVSPTDAAAVFFLLRVGGITLRERVRATLEVESGSNDPMAIFLDGRAGRPRSRERLGQRHLLRAGPSICPANRARRGRRHPWRIADARSGEPHQLRARPLSDPRDRDGAARLCRCGADRRLRIPRRISRGDRCRQLKAPALPRTETLQRDADVALADRDVPGARPAGDTVGISEGVGACDRSGS